MTHYKPANEHDHETTNVRPFVPRRSLSSPKSETLADFPATQSGMNGPDDDPGPTAA